MARVRFVSWNPQRALFDPASEAFHLSVQSLVLDAQRNLRERAPGTARIQTGNLSKSIRALHIGKYTGKLVARTKYAASQELGSRPHEINARRKPNLVFPWEGAANNGWFIGPRVNHPGTQALHFLWDAAQKLGDRMKTYGRMVFR